jgi:hypothetical protein
MVQRINCFVSQSAILKYETSAGWVAASSPHSMATTWLGNSGVAPELRTHFSRALDPAGSAPHQQISVRPPVALASQSAQRTLAPSVLASTWPAQARHAWSDMRRAAAGWVATASRLSMLGSPPTTAGNGRCWRHDEKACARKIEIRRELILFQAAVQAARSIGLRLDSGPTDHTSDWA